jgi:glucose-1-phosphate thymidylyltransferase
MLAGLNIIISTSQTYPILKLLGDGSDIGCKFAYAEQAVPKWLRPL